MEEEHVDNFNLERFCVDDLPADSRAQIAAHVNQCPRCASFVERTKEHVSADLALHPSAAFVQSVQSVQSVQEGGQGRWRWQWFLPVMATAGAAAALILPMLSPSPDVR